MPRSPCPRCGSASCCAAHRVRTRSRGPTSSPAATTLPRRRSPSAARRSRGDSLSDILFTSGTTGRPKGAMLTHGASVKAYDTWATVVGLRAGDRYLIVNPFFHSFGLKAGILASLLKGATIVPHAVFDVEQVMQRVAEEHISMLPGPPTIYQSILDHPRVGEFDLSSLRLAVTGAAPVPMELIRRMRDELKFENVVTRLRAHRSDRHRDDVPARRSRREDLGDRGPGHSRYRAPHRRRRQPVGRRRRCRRGRDPRLQRDAGLPRRSRSHGRGHRRRRLAAHRRHRDARRERQPAHHRPQEGHVHRRRVQRVSRRDREHAQCAPRGEPGRDRRRARPATRRGRLRVPRAAARRSRSTPTR